MYNIDERDIQQKFKTGSVVSDADTIPERSSITTVLGCDNALEQAIPLFLTFAGARIRQELLEG